MFRRVEPPAQPDPHRIPLAELYRTNPPRCEEPAEPTPILVRQINLGIRAINIPLFTRRIWTVAAAKAGIGSLLLYNGIRIAGSYYYPKTAITGWLADWAYTYQGGTTLLVIGLLFLYESLNGLRNEYYKY